MQVAVRTGIDFDHFLRVSSGNGRDGAASDSQQHRRSYLRDCPCTGAVIAINTVSLTYPGPTRLPSTPRHHICTSRNAYSQKFTLELLQSALDFLRWARSYIQE
jgi:hypothetical protein